MSTQQTIYLIACILAAIGAINWGLSVHGINLVATVSMGSTLAEKIIYYIVALAGLYLLYACASKLL
jgi:uncharacterized membrane protein YuzA (DUF378 family)